MTEYTCSECGSELDDYCTLGLVCRECVSFFSDLEVQEWDARAIKAIQREQDEEWARDQEWQQPYEYLHHADCTCSTCNDEDDPDLEGPDIED